MDDETQAALDLTDDQLRAMRDAAEPAVVAKRPRDLNQRARSIVDQAISRFEERQTVRVRVVASGTSASTEVHQPEGGAALLERVEDDTVTAVAYRVG